MVDNTPDFDNMSEEEIMNWMESLARRAGATEGFTTSADMDIAEIDPDSVVIDEPGYVPYSERSSDSTARMPAQPPPPPEPIIEEITIEEADLAADSLPAAETGSLDWLESLAADQSDSLFNLDLSAIEVAGAPVEAPAPRVNPEAWLQNLTQSQGESVLGGSESEDEGDTLEWLETLAVRQGADRDELLTDAALDIPEPEAEVEPSVYTPFSFETPSSYRSSTSEASGADPEDFLRSLSIDSGYSEDGVLATQKSAAANAEEDAEVVEAISQGTVTADQMQEFLERQMDRAMETPEPEIEDAADGEEETSLEKAELPEWFLQEIGGPPAPEAPRDLPPLESILPEPEEEAASTGEQMPEWLVSAEEPATETFDLAALLNDDGEAPASDVFTAAADQEQGDTWAEAFDVEHDAGPGDLSNPPEWYLKNLSDSQRIERINRIESGEEAPATLELIDEPLPEEHLLPEGQPQAVPDWMNIEAGAPVAIEDEPLETAAEAVAEVDGMPDWLQEEVQPEVSGEAAPWWDQAPEDADTVETLTSLRAAPAFEPPTPSYAAQRVLDASATLENARSLQRSGDLESSLQQYESLIVRNSDLDSAVDDLTNLVRIHRENPVIHRLLGDGYVRQGRLQQALDTYREALNYL